MNVKYIATVTLKKLKNQKLFIKKLSLKKNIKLQTTFVCAYFTSKIFNFPPFKLTNLTIQ